MTVTIDEPVPPRLSLARLFLKFLRFGCLAFGGPVAQIAMVRQELVAEERWISSERFNRLLALMQALPGPEAHELCVHMGMVARGRVGGLLAGLGFMLPGFGLMLAAAWAYETLVAGRADLAGALLGVQIVIVALIARAVQRIAAHVLEDRLLWILGAGGGVATLAGAAFWIPLSACGLVYALASRPWVAAAVALAAIGLALGLQPLAAGGATAPAISIEGEAGALALFVAGLKGGLLTFGGAYTAIPFVRADTVGQGWISDGTFLDGVALAGVLPAPLVIFCTFVGYVAGGWIGALAITVGVFLPAFGFSMLLFDRLETIIETPSLHRLLAGVAAAVAGVIAATCVQLGWAVIERAPKAWPLVVLFVLAFAGAWLARGRFAPPVLIALGGIMGWMVFGD